jgi:hypothetical protein
MKPGTNIILVGKLVLLTFLLLIISGVGSNFIPGTAMEAGGDAAVAGSASAAQVGVSLPVLLAIFFCQVVALSVPILRSRWRGWLLAATIFTVYFGTVSFMSLIEAAVYLDNKMPQGMVQGLFLMGLVTAAVFSPIAVWILGKWKAAPGSGDATGARLDLGPWAWKVLFAGLLFLVLYYVFGYYIAWQDPDLRAYYGGTDPGSFVAQMVSVMQATPWMVPLQFLRGLLWVGFGLLIIQSMRGSWWEAGLATSLLFAVPALYLLFPNPVMPDFPRMTHLVETLPYQFLFGWFLAWFVTGREVTEVAQERAA